MIDPFIYRQNKIEIWNNPQIWGIDKEELCSDWLKQELNQFKSKIIFFIDNGYSKQASKQVNCDHSFLRRLAYYTIEMGNIIDALCLVNGWEGKLGLELAKITLKIYQKNNQKLPTSKKYNGIQGILKKGGWVEFGINSWNELLNETFNDVNRNIRYPGEEGLKCAVKELQLFKENNNRMPTSDDIGMAGIMNGIRERWKEFGITSWNDLLKYAFGDVNRIYRKYEGQKGFDRAVKELNEIYSKTGRIPSTTDKGMTHIWAVIKKGYWTAFGINSWNDMLMHLYGAVNIDASKYHGREGLDLAKNELIEFEKTNNRLPKCAEFQNIANIISRGIWTQFEIHTWNDLMKEIFGEVNIENKRVNYIGKKGLLTAKKELKEFRNSEYRLPKSNDTEFRAIHEVIFDKIWIDYGINCWNDLLNQTFGEINVNCNKYIGKSGLDIAIQELKEYESKNGKIPSLHTKNMSSICCAINRSEWAEYGINSWNDLINLVFGDVKYELGWYIGKKGLDRAIERLQAIQKKYGTIPTTTIKEVNRIYLVLKKKPWIEFGIRTWNDLLMKACGQIYVEKDKYIGKEGLNRALNEVRQIWKEQGKFPTCTQKGINGPYKTIKKGLWQEFGVNTWIDLKNLLINCEKQTKLQNYVNLL